jgi:hypothetical protein
MINLDELPMRVGSFSETTWLRHHLVPASYSTFTTHW